MKLTNEKDLPKSRCEILKWARIHFNLTPAVNDIITRAANNIGEVVIKCSDKKLNAFYQSMAYNDKFNLDTFIQSVALSYFKFGEAIPYGNMVERDGRSMWAKFILLEPELVNVSTNLISQENQLDLIMTEEVREQVKDGTITEPRVVEAVKNGINLELPERDISLLAYYTDPSATRGTSPIQSLFRDLHYLEKLRGKKITRRISDEMSTIMDGIRTSLSLRTQGNLLNVRKVIGNWIERKFFKPVMKLNKMKTAPVITWKPKEITT